MSLLQSRHFISLASCGSISVSFITAFKDTSQSAAFSCPSLWMQADLNGPSKKLNIITKKKTCSSCHRMNPQKKKCTAKEKPGLELGGMLMNVFCLLNLGEPPVSWWLRWQRICLQSRRPRFNPWVWKIPWRRYWQPSPVFWSGESHGQRSLADYSPWGRKELDMTEWLTYTYISETSPVSCFLSSGAICTGELD